MSEKFEFQSEEELRQAIRAEIEQRDRERQHRTQEREQVQSDGLNAERRRQIYQEELRRYYSQKPGYREISREDGESDWIPESEFQRSNSLFEEALADPADVRRRLKWSLAATAAAIVVLAAVFFFVLAARTGSIAVSSNVRGAQIILDTVPLQLVTDTTLEEVPEGEHVVTVQKEGYAVVGEPVQRVTIRGGKTVSLSFTLQPIEQPNKTPRP